MAISLVLQLREIRCLRDGGGRITFDFGKDSLKSIQELQNLNSKGDLNLGVAIVPFSDESVDPLKLPDLP